MNYGKLVEVVKGDAAIRRRRRLQPAGGMGDKIFPPTYSGKNGPEHVFETRRIRQADGKMDAQVCVLIDSVQSQANRLEEALEVAAETGDIELPRIVVDFAQTGLNSVGNISDLLAPHRVFDAILRDSEIDGTLFRETELGLAIERATPSNASAILQVSPASLLFGAWDSTGEGGGMGAKFARSIVSEIIGVNCPVDEAVDRGTGEVVMRTSARRTVSRIDPLGIVGSVDVWKGANGWATSEEDAGKGAKIVKPSMLNHGNIVPSFDMLGVTCDYAEQTAVLSLAGLRRLSFSDRRDEDKDVAGRAYLAALGLLALIESDENGFALRSRCDLVGEGAAPFQVVRPDGTTKELSIDLANARKLYAEAMRKATGAGFQLTGAPLRLKPAAKLVQIVEQSQTRAQNVDDKVDED